jgi:hypothetical protein
MNVSRRPDWAHVRADARAGVSDFRQKRDDEKPRGVRGIRRHLKQFRGRTPAPTAERAVRERRILGNPCLE